LARSRATIAAELSMPATRTPCAASGSAMRPADPELERAAVAGERGEQRDGRVDHRRVEDRRVVVVPRRDALAEEAAVRRVEAVHRGSKAGRPRPL
jgi:hypothetical protein